MSNYKGKKYVLIFLVGLALVTEHIVTYGYYDFELIGHETYGFILMLLGMALFWYKNHRVKHFVIDSKEESPDESSRRGNSLSVEVGAKLSLAVLLSDYFGEKILGS